MIFSLSNLPVYDRTSLTTGPKLIHDVYIDPHTTPIDGFPTGLAAAPDGEVVLIAGFEVATPVVTLSTGRINVVYNDLEMVTSVHAAGRWFGFGGSTNLYSRVEDLRCTDSGPSGRELDLEVQPEGDRVRHIVWAGGRDATVIRALRVVPELEITYLGSHAGHVQVVDWEHSPETAYRFMDDPPIFSLDRAGMFLVIAAKDQVGVITYGVGKPYAGLFE
jgi:hypothetical protein